METLDGSYGNIMTIPKFRSIWIKTKESHPDKDFREFIDSLSVQK